MYTILVTNDNQLVTSVKTRIMQRSKLVDNLHFLVPQQYNDIDMNAFTSVLMEYILPVSREYKTEFLTKSLELYKDQIEYKLPFDSNLTREAGKIDISLTFIKVEMDVEGNVKQRVRKAGPATITIVPSTKWSDVVPDESLGALDQRLIQLEIMANQLNDLNQLMYTTKADDIMYSQDGQYIQLLANGNPIGSQIKVSTSSDINSVVGILINESGEMVVNYENGYSENIGKIQCEAHSGLYVPRFDNDKLIFELKEMPGDERVIYDLDRTNEWSEVEDIGKTTYIWEFI